MWKQTCSVSAGGIVAGNRSRANHDRYIIIREKDICLRNGDGCRRAASLEKDADLVNAFGWQRPEQDMPNRRE